MEDKLAKSLECSICLDQLHEPKNLVCHHTFCKQCLDNLVQFNEDKTGVIYCPFKCGEVTVISDDQTVDSLPTNYQLKGVLDVLKEVSTRENHRHKCSESHCSRDVAFLCTTCSCKTCQECWTLHVCSEQSSIPVIFNERRNEVLPYCIEHSSTADRVCLDCNVDQFVCNYCRHRAHRDHNCISIGNVAIDTKDRLCSKVGTAQRDVAASRKLSEKYANAIREIGKIRARLIVELKKRKLHCLVHVYRLLNHDEEKILSEFDENADLFQFKVNSTGLFTLCEKDEDEILISYSTMIESKQDFELIATTDNIETSLQELCLDRRTLPIIRLNLESPNNDLGYLNTCFGFAELEDEGLKTTELADSNIQALYESDIDFNTDIEVLNGFLVEIQEVNSRSTELEVTHEIDSTSNANNRSPEGGTYTSGSEKTRYKPLRPPPPMQPQKSLPSTRLQMPPPPPPQLESKMRRKAPQPPKPPIQTTGGTLAVSTEEASTTTTNTAAAVDVAVTPRLTRANSGRSFFQYMWNR